MAFAAEHYHAFRFNALCRVTRWTPMIFAMPGLGYRGSARRGKCSAASGLTGLGRAILREAKSYHSTGPAPADMLPHAARRPLRMRVTPSWLIWKPFGAACGKALGGKRQRSLNPL